MKRPLAATTWDDFHPAPAPKLREPENPKPVEIIHFKATKEALEITYYLEGILKEHFKSVDLDTLKEWAVENKEINVVYELPYYDQDSGEEYLTLYPATSEIGTAEQININRFEKWLKELTEEDCERILMMK